MEHGCLRELKTILRSLLISSPAYTTINKLNRDYMEIEGCPIPYGNLGFSDLESFLRSIPDTVQVFGFGNTATVCFISNQKSDHIHKLVRQQKRPKALKGCTQMQFYRRGENCKTNYSPILLTEVNSYDKNKFIKLPNQIPLPTKENKFHHKTKPSLEIPHFNLSNKICMLKQRKSKDCEHVKGVNIFTTNSITQRSNVPRKLLKPIISTGHFDCLTNTFDKVITLKDTKETSSESDLLQSISVNDFLSYGNGKAMEFFESLDSVPGPPQDLYEAVPEFAATDLVFRMDFPENAVLYGTKIASYRWPIGLKCGSIIRIFISEIHNPFKFWFHLYKEDDELDDLMLQIRSFYTCIDIEDFRIPRACIIPGQVCAALYNSMWHRAEVVSPITNNKVKVFFVDYGTVSAVHTDDIKYLSTAFANNPKQAFRGCLSHVKPRGLHWRIEATKCFLLKVCELMLYCKVSEIDEERQVLYMVVCDTHGNEVVQINKTLVEEGFALYDDEWERFKLRKVEYSDCCDLK